VHVIRRRIRGERGKPLLRQRGELVEQSLADSYETRGMSERRLRGRESVAKQALIHAGGENLGVLMRLFDKMSMPIGLSGRAGHASCALWESLWGVWLIIVRLLVSRDAITSDFSADCHDLRLQAA